MRLRYLALAIIVFALSWQLTHLIAFAYTAGKMKVISVWPSDSRIRPYAEGLSLFVVLHPKCQCSEATLEGVRRIQEAVAGPLRTKIIFMNYPELGVDWGTNPLMAKVKPMIHTEVVFDLRGGEAKKSGAFTSGAVYLVDPDGRVFFQGGITPSRGHEGPTPGEEFIVKAVNQVVSKPLISKIFGCNL